MEISDLFHKWVPLYVRLPVLFILVFAILVANGAYVGNFNETANHLGVYAEPFTEAYNAVYIGMGLGLIFHVRLKLRFTNKQLLLFGLIALLVMNIVCATTSSTAVFIGACLVIGFTKISALIEVYIIWVLIWSKKFDASRFYPSFYFTALSGIYFTYWATSQLAYHYNWRYAYIAVFVLLLVCLLCAVLLVENHPLKHKIPLYQVDYLGLALLAAALMLFNYAIVNGKVEDWMASKVIVGSFWGSIIFFLLFIKRQLSLKRPLLDLAIFKKGNFRMGLFYCLIAGIFLPGTFQSVFSSAVLRYDAPTNMLLNLYLVPGILIGCIICFFWYYYSLDPDILIIAGFLSLIFYHLMMYFLFSKSFSKQDFILPSFFKGFGISLIYIAVGLLTIKGFGLDKVTSAAGAMLICRSFLGSGVFTSLYAYYFYTQRIRHADYLAVGTDANNLFVHASGKGLYQMIQEQATLNASKELTGMICIAGCVVMTGLLANYMIKCFKTA